MGLRLLAEVPVVTSTGIASAWLSAGDNEAARASIALLSPALAQSVSA